VRGAEHEPARQPTHMTDVTEFTIVALRRTTGWRVFIRAADAAMTRREFPVAQGMLIGEEMRLIDEMAGAPATRG
jgi:hypothetical protein